MTQKCHGNFNFTHGNFNLLMAISIYSRQFQFTHSKQFQFYSRQFQFFHGNAHGVFASLTTCQLRRPTVAMHQKSKRKIKSQCLKSIFKEKNENHKSKVDLRTSRTIGGTDLHETGTGRTQTGRSSYRSPYISFHAYTWDRPKNELRPVWLYLSRWPDTSYFRTGLRPSSSHVKQKKNLRPGP